MAVISNPGNAPVTDLNQPKLIEPLQRLPQSLPIDPQLGSKGPLSRQSNPDHKSAVKDLRGKLIKHRRGNRLPPNRSKVPHDEGQPYHWSDHLTSG
jgi:hypothetical protein